MIPEQAQAILLLPSGHRAFDEDFAVAFPVPRTIDVGGLVPHGVYGLVHIHHSGTVDDVTRALYVLGGHYRPHGASCLRLDPDEAHDQ